MSFKLAYSQNVEQSINVDLMDVKNIGNMILGYVDEYSQAFLVRFFNFLNKLIEDAVYLNKEKTEWYLCELDLEEITEELIKEKNCSSLQHYFSPKSFGEQDLVKEIITSVSKDKPQNILNLKINKKLAIGINGFAHNDDSRSKRSRDFMLKEKFINDALVKVEMTYEKNKFVTYFPNGFTVKEYISEYLQIRGTPYDRHYTMYNKVVFPSPKKLEKIRELLKETQLEANDCILADFDFGS
jgi:hypothetical protein